MRKKKKKKKKNLYYITCQAKELQKLIWVLGKLPKKKRIAADQMTF
jgi:hypothetical protein